MASSVKALPYLRCSTDDKGHEPLRQLDMIRPWAEREGVELADASARAALKWQKAPEGGVGRAHTSRSSVAPPHVLRL